MIEFLFKEWSSVVPAMLKNVTLIVTHGEKCHMIEYTNDKLLVREIVKLISDNEEADTRMLLHALNASTYFKNVIIKSLDTDVFILSHSKSRFLTSQLYLLLGNASNSELINVSTYFRSLIIKSLDVDVFIISLSKDRFLTAQLHLLLGNVSNSEFINISLIATILGPDICDSVLGLHIFRGCDSCNAFKGKRKVKAFNVMKTKNL